MGLNNQSIEQLLRAMNKIDSTIESGGYVTESCMEAKKNIGKVLAGKVQNTIDTAITAYDNGTISEAYYEEVMEEMLPIYEEAFTAAYPFYEESSVAQGLGVTLNEVAAFTKIVPIQATVNVLSVPQQKFISNRLKRYPVLHTDAIGFEQFTKTMYGIQEVEEKFHVKPKYADKWMEFGNRTEVAVYSYKNKPVMGIIFTKTVATFNSFKALETFFLDPKFRKYEDYYIACMATKNHLSHPATKRLMDSMKKEWSSVKKKQLKAIKEEAEQNELNGESWKNEEKIKAVMEAAENGFLKESDARNYMALIQKSQLIMKR